MIMPFDVWEAPAQLTGGWEMEKSKKSVMEKKRRGVDLNKMITIKIHSAVNYKKIYCLSIKSE